jgi:alpha-galactosidase
MIEPSAAQVSTSWLTLRRDGVMVVFDVSGPHLPRIVYWGADLGDLIASEFAQLPAAEYTTPTADTRDADVPVTVLPSRAQGWPGWPGLTGHRDGLASQPLFVQVALESEEADDGHSLRYGGVDEAAALRLEGEFVLTPEGVLRHRQTLASTAASDAMPYVVDDLLTLLPVSEHVAEVFDYAGRWGNEAQAQRQTLNQGTWLREQRRGRTGPDSPLLMMVGTAGFNHRDGEVWGIHLGWSGDQRYLTQRLNTGVVMLGAGEILAAGEVILAAGESITTPWAYAVYSDAGIDGASRRLHTMLRRRPSHPLRPRPIVLNTWEAVYFDHSFERLAALADVAGEIGVERFVIDDGWFGSRRDIRSGLGDWYVSEQVWPGGLGRIADYVRARGMEFGLWFEPEMVNLDSDVARAHPDWVIGTPGRMPPPSRAQQVLDAANPDAYAYLLERISTLVTEFGISYLKWDHNRDLADPVHRGGPHAGRPAVREQTLAAYRLMSQLRERHPGLEIESCSSGGARIDYGVLEHTDRVWASDCIDPVERVRIVAGTSTLLPFELIGAHVGSGRNQVTGRSSDLALRLAVALFGHAGLEWDLTTTSPEVRAQLAEWVALAKSLRPLLHTGQLVRVDRPADHDTVMYGVVSPDRLEALFSIVRLQSGRRSGTAPLVFDGLDPSVRYRVRRVLMPGEDFHVHGPEVHEGARDLVAPGSLLSGAGVAAPNLQPEQAAIYHLQAGPKRS